MDKIEVLAQSEWERAFSGTFNRGDLQSAMRGDISGRRGGWNDQSFGVVGLLAGSRGCGGARLFTTEARGLSSTTIGVDINLGIEFTPFIVPS